MDNFLLPPFYFPPLSTFYFSTFNFPFPLSHFPFLLFTFQLSYFLLFTFLLSPSPHSFNNLCVKITFPFSANNLSRYKPAAVVSFTGICVVYWVMFTSATNCPITLCTFSSKGFTGAVANCSVNPATNGLGNTSIPPAYSCLGLMLSQELPAKALNMRFFIFSF